MKIEAIEALWVWDLEIIHLSKVERKIDSSMLFVSNSISFSFNIYYSGGT